MPLPYFPLAHDSFALRMDARPTSSPLVEVDPAAYASELDLKDQILARDEGTYFQCPPDALPLAWETLTILLQDMARHNPEHFSLRVEPDRWRWENRLLGQSIDFVPGRPETLPRQPLDWIGRQVQEDLVLMGTEATGAMVCRAGHVCFPSQWSLQEKIGLTFPQIHEPVPGFAESAGPASDRLLRGLKVGRPVERCGWSLLPTDRLDLAPSTREEWRHASEGAASLDPGDRCFFRIERQTLSRLPGTGGVLFTIRTYLAPLRELAADPFRRRRLLAVLQDIPASMRRYKDLEPYFLPVVQYLAGEE